MADTATVTILMATFNGAPFLGEQLTSIARQDWPSIDIWASDDGSTDTTLEILSYWKARWTKGDFHITTGPGNGYVENFRQMMANPSVSGAYVAFSDQDDIWDPDKLTHAVACLDEAGSEGPVMYCSRTRLVGNAGAPRGLSPLFSRRPTFGNAIVQSIGGGNTIALNSAAFRLVQESARRTSFVSHDWWCYQIVSGAGGKVIYDPVPRIGYRQHERNLIGENQGWRARLKRISALMHGRFAEWNATNVEALELCRDMLDDNGRRTLNGFMIARNSGPLKSVFYLWRCGIHRQTRFSDAALFFAALFRKL